MNPSAPFGQLLAGHRVLAGMRSQSELARQLGVSHSQVNRWEQDQAAPSVAEVVVLDLMLDAGGVLRDAWERENGKLPERPRRLVDDKARAAAVDGHLAAAVAALQQLRTQIAKQPPQPGPGSTDE